MKTIFFSNLYSLIIFNILLSIFSEHQIQIKENCNNNFNQTQQLKQKRILEEKLINKYINEFTYYRIDSLFNGYSITNKDSQNVTLGIEKKGDSQNFIFINLESNYYFIECRLTNKRLGINENNKITVYDKRDEKNKDKMLWKIQLYESDNNNKNRFLFQNKFSSNYLELKEINDTHCELYCELKEYKEVKYHKVVFILVKIFEVININPEHLKIIEKEPIDIVIKYIDLTDKNLKREGIKQIKKDEDNEELKYSVRSIFKYVSWVRKVFIIMPNEKVRYFKPYEEIKDRIVYVKDKDLVGFDSANSAVFQFNLFRLKNFGLSENFIYMDDDYFFGNDLKKSDFFYYDEEQKRVLPFIITHDFKEIDIKETYNQYNKLFNMRNELDPHKFWGWKLSIYASEKLILENYELHPMITTFFNHVAIPLNIHDIEECFDLILRRYKYLEETLYSLERHILILQSEHLFVLYGLNIKKRKVHFIWYNYILLNDVKDEYLHMPLYVINTDGNEQYTEEHYKNARKVLEQRYPERTPYELPYDVPIEKNENILKTDEIKIKKQEKKDAKIDFSLTNNEFYMENINLQKKKELEIKYKKIIKNYKKSISILFIIFVLLLLLLVLLRCFIKI